MNIDRQRCKDRSCLSLREIDQHFRVQFTFAVYASKSKLQPTSQLFIQFKLQISKWVSPLSMELITTNYIRKIVWHAKHNFSKYFPIRPKVGEKKCRIRPTAHTMQQTFFSRRSSSKRGKNSFIYKSDPCLFTKYVSISSNFNRILSKKWFSFRGRFTLGARIGEHRRRIIFIGADLSRLSQNCSKVFYNERYYESLKF